MSDDLVARLRHAWDERERQLDEDERVARAATGGPWEVGPSFGGRDNRVYVKPEGPGIDTIGTCVIAGQVANMPEFRANAGHIARHDPARVLAEVERGRRDIAAKRRILDKWADLRSDVADALNRDEPDEAPVVTEAAFEHVVEMFAEAEGLA